MFSFCTWRSGADLYQIVFINISSIKLLCSTFMKCNYSATYTSLVYHMKNVFIVFLSGSC